MAKNILITGISGFVGSNLTSYLKPAWDVSAVSTSKVQSRSDLKHVYTWDQLSVDVISQFDCVIHLAGKAHDLKNTADAGEYFKINTQLTKKLYDLFVESTAKDFIYFSSVKAVADRVDGVLIEDAGSEPQTPYGMSKKQAEDYILSVSAPVGKRVFVLRPCMIHGPGNKGNLNLLYKFVSKGIPYPLAAFENQRSFLSIGNLQYIVARLANESTIPGGVYNVADDEPLSTNQVIKIISSTIGARAKLWKLSPLLIRMLARAGDILHLPINSERLKKLTESYVVSNNKIKTALNVKNLPVLATDGLGLTIRSFSSK